MIFTTRCFGNIMVILCLIASTSVCAAATKRATIVMTEIKYERQGVLHEYSIFRNPNVTKSKSGLPKKPTFVLSFKENSRSVKKRELTPAQADFYVGQISRLIWSSEYSRKPASTSPCREYVRLKNQSDQTKICQQNKKLVGESYGLLKQLRAQFGG